MGILRYAPQAIKNMFLPPVTTKYPFEPAEYPEGSRGHVEIEINRCIGCGLCARCCPCGAIKVERIKGTWAIDRFDCIACGFCVEKCPPKCLSMKEGYHTPGEKTASEIHSKSPGVLEAEKKKREEAAKKAAEAKGKKDEAKKSKPPVEKPSEEAAVMQTGVDVMNAIRASKMAASATMDNPAPLAGKSAAQTEGRTGLQAAAVQQPAPEEKAQEPERPLTAIELLQMKKRQNENNQGYY